METETVAPSTPTPIVAPRRRGKNKRTIKQPSVRTLPPEAIASLSEPSPSPEVSSMPSRPAMRPEVRLSDPRSDANARAAEILGHLDGSEVGADDFYFDKSTIPPGWSYEWKRVLTYNQPDPAYEVALARTGWTAVPASRHPEMMPLGTQIETIDRKGLRLFERPESVTKHFADKDKIRARDQVQYKQEQLTAAPQGHFERQNKDAPLAKIKKSYEPMPIPAD